MKRVKWVSLVVAVSLLLVLTALMAAHARVASAAAPSNPFVGAWESTDTDGSHQMLSIGGGARGSHVQLYDDVGSVCDFSLQRPAEASGVGQIEGNDLMVWLTAYCLQPRQFVGAFFVVYTFDSATGTLTDSFGVVWYRQH